MPTIEETLRIKAFLAVRRNQVRDYLDLAALSDVVGVPRAADVLNALDDHDADQLTSVDGVASQIARQLADPRPRDHRVTAELQSYKGISPRWASWPEIVRVLGEVAVEMYRGSWQADDVPRSST